MSSLYKIYPSYFFLMLFYIMQGMVQTISAQNIKFIWEDTKIPVNGKLILIMSSDKKFQKEMLQLNFPDYDDFIKDRTILTWDKTENIARIIQFYSPLKQGEYNLPPSSLKLGNVTIGIPSATAIIGASKTGYKTPFYEDLSTENLEFSESKNETMIRLSASKYSAYEGERIYLELAVYTIDNGNSVGLFDLLQQRNIFTKKISRQNCIVDNTYVKDSILVSKVELDNKKYTKRIIYAADMYSIDSTDIDIPSIEFKIYTYKTARSGNNFIERREQLKTISSDPVKIKIKKLPAHPMRDNVAVGTFNITEHISSFSTYTGNSIKYTITISGNGNLSAMNNPVIIPNEHFDIYAPSIKESIQTQDGKHKVSKSFTYYIIAKQAGKYSLSNNFKWVYFNLNKQNYDTICPRISLLVKEDNNAGSTITYDEGSFFKQIFSESNKLRSKEKDKTINLFANLIILFMLVFTAILIFRKSS